MAWEWHVEGFDPYYIVSNASNIVKVYKKRYEVRTLQFDEWESPTSEVTFSIERYVGNPTAYIIELLDDDIVQNHLSNTEGVPRDYFARFSPGQSITFDFDPLAEYAIVLADETIDTSDDYRNVECKITFVDSGGPSTRYFIARKASSNSIYIEIRNSIADLDGGFRFELLSQTTTGLEYYYPTTVEYADANSHTFSDLPYGTYEVHIYQYYNSGARREPVRTATDKGYLVIDLSQLWELWPGGSSEDLGRITTLYSREFSGTYERTLYRYRMTFPGTGRVTFSSSGNTSRLNLDAWLSDSTQSLNYDRSTGVPDASRASDTSSNNHFSITYNCTEGRTYYLWFKNKEGTSSSEEFIININPVDFQSWAYDTRYADQFELEEVTVPEVELKNKIGARFKFSCSGSGTVRIQPYNTGAYAYVTTDDYGFDPADGIPYSNSAKTVKATGSRNLTYDVTGFTQYYLWIRGTSSEGYDTCEVTITPPTVTYTWQTNDQTGDTSVQNLSRDVSNKLITITRNVRNHIAYTLKYAVSFSRTGKAVFSSSNISSTGTMKLNAYIGSQDGNIDRDNGVPLNYSKMAQGNNNFRLELNVTAGTTYYLWIKASSPKVDGTAMLGIIVPQDTGTTKGVWINTEGNNSTWVKAKVWLNTDGTDGGWVRVKPDLFDSETNIWIVGS